VADFLTQIWNWVAANWPALAAWIVLMLGVWLRGITREQIAKIIGDVLCLVEEELRGIVSDVPEALLRQYADVAYEELDAILGKLPFGAFILTLYKARVSELDFENLVISVWNKYVLRQAAVRTAMQRRLFLVAKPSPKLA
jgi:hypothetical protein